MPTKLLICDDSNMARKQVARSLPDDWDVDISFATNGVEGIEAIKEGKGDVLLLDLNMPEMDGYQVLEAILQQDLPTLTIVISGDIQPEAHQRVTALGALDFIQKPVNKDKLTEVLLSYGVFTKPSSEAIEPVEVESAEVAQAKATDNVITQQTADSTLLSTPEAQTARTVPDASASQPLHVQPIVEETPEEDEPEITMSPDMRDCYQEIANVAMGRAGDLLARVLNVKVRLPIPKVNALASSELHMMLKATDDVDSISAVC